MRKATLGKNNPLGSYLTSAEVLARCPTDGRPPWNTPAELAREGIAIVG